MSNWKNNDFKCKNESCAKLDLLVEDILYKDNEPPVCDSCESQLVKQLTPNWSQGRHHTVNAWRIG
jgi:hypothetical protein